jgi:hypothetical protein
MDLPRLHSLGLYHKDHPPQHIVVANLGRYFGVVEEAKSEEMTDADFDELMAAFPQTPAPPKAIAATETSSNIEG